LATLQAFAGSADGQYRSIRFAVGKWVRRAGVKTRQKTKQTVFDQLAGEDQFWVLATVWGRFGAMGLAEP